MSARDHDNVFSSMSLESFMKEEVAHAARYEQELTVLERNLCAGLKEAREKIALYNEKKALVQDHIELAKREAELNIPMIGRARDKTLETVHEVEWKLPGIRSQLMEIRKVYDLGRRRAQTLQAEMEWKAKTDFQQWRSTLLGKSPLSPQQVKREWIKLSRRLFLVALSLIFFLYFIWAMIIRRS
ncbi:hypothetical protein K439DRAFT_1632135 [Ramaria rubella]|nr:hypothetical protein K439DRAFT_1632135 [Ramaria rubella]